jgi:tetratricopeptide (TPR) repeat protein
MGQYNRAMQNATATVELVKAQLAQQPPTAAGLNELQQAYASQYGVLEAYLLTLGERTAAGQPTGRLLAGREREAAAGLKEMADLRVIQAQVAHTMQYFEVLAHLQQAVQLVPDDPQYWLEYGLVLLQVSHPEKAAQAFKKVLELDPDNAEARRQLDRLNAAPTSSPAARDTP